MEWGSLHFRGRFLLKFRAIALGFILFGSLVFSAPLESTALSNGVAALCDRIEHGLDAVAGEHLQQAKVVSSFYRDRQNHLAWLDASGRKNPAADAMMDQLHGISQHGLRPDLYHLKTIEKLVSLADSESIDRMVSLEILLTDSFLTLGEHLFSGAVDPIASNPDWAVRHRRINMKKQLEHALTDSTVAEVLKQLAPKDDRYLRLQAALSTYLGYKKFNRIAGGSNLKFGNRGVRVQQLRNRLQREGYLTKGGSDSALFDTDVKTAVLSFQASHGLSATGMVNKDTLKELNVPLDLRIRQILVNLERLRWLPRELGNPYVFVDIADYTLSAYEAGLPVLNMRIIVGEETKVTPMFSAKMKSVILNPSWVVPKSIVTEMLPQLRDDPSYLKKKGIHVSATVAGSRSELESEAIDWSQYKGDDFGFSFEAPSGPSNPLGSIKFLLPNEYAIYLHGTPDPKLFDREKRNLSHGCIRVEKPTALAAYVLKNSVPPWPETEIDEVIGSGTNLSLDLPTPVPVYLWYRTSWVDSDNKVQFRRDTYNWDTSLWQILSKL